MRRSGVCLILLGLVLAAPVRAQKPPKPSSAAAGDGLKLSAHSWSFTYGRCREALRERELAAVVDLCRRAVDLAEAAGDQDRADQVALLQSYESYGQALLALGRGPEALAAEVKAVSLAEAHFRDSDQEYAMPFYWRALVESHFRDGASASADLTVAETSYRKAMTASPRLRPLYAQHLARILRQHAALLEAMGQPEDAEKLRSQAGSL